MTRYERGFMNKCAEYGVDGRQVLAAMQKEAGLSSILAKLRPTMTKTVAKLSPKVNPDKLNKFTRLFTRTKTRPIFDTVSRTMGAVPSYESYGGMIQPDILREANPVGVRSVTRLAPDRIAAAIAGVGGTGMIAADVLGGGAPATAPAVTPAPAPAPEAKKVSGLSPEAKKAILALLGIGGVAAGGYAVAKSVGGKKNKKDDKKKQKPSDKK